MTTADRNVGRLLGTRLLQARNNRLLIPHPLRDDKATLAGFWGRQNQRYPTLAAQG